ncbi:MAG: ABC transporter permease [Deltaproteobacteria bacterium]|jgi:putative ABC transport system permease protein|nr:ABC transporter permease [Deltaproteobacteria bacterium]MBT4639186.1 ABC transporter permease [Deltaproteobacteria bacterium]MBT6501021.1 ABC transporter permease [Deltaproteobacteria bacterium]MBT7713251.1 ABC transporter permease [Deltaproteobacteria bacterium]MBT7892299.1 ABC transporter permease [Deltaproteobacteria bacterium]
MTLWIRLALKELISNKRFSLFFILNLSIGLVGFIALNSFNYSLHSHFQRNLRDMMTADFILRSSRALNPEESTMLDGALGSDFSRSQQVRFFSMVSAPTQSKLAEIIAIDGYYPLYGRIVLEKNGISNPATVQTSLTSKAGVWVSRNVAINLGLKIGSPIQIGKKTFRVDDFITEDPDSTVTSIEFAPRFYISREQIKDTGLIQFGSRINHLIFYRYPEGTDIKSITEPLKKELKEYYKGASEISIYDSRRVNRQLGRIINNFTGYMGLVGIVALFLAGIGTAYLFRSYLNGNLKEIAILMSLGASRPEAYFLFLFQVVILGVISSLLAIGLSTILLPAFPVILAGVVPPDLVVATDQNSLLLALVLGTVGSIVFCLPVITRIHRLKPLTLLQGSSGDQPLRLRKRILQFGGFAPAILLFWGLSIFQARSLERGSIFLGGFMGVMVIIAGIGWLLFKGYHQMSRTANPIRKIAFRNLYRNKFSSLSCFLTIAMGAFLINLIPQLQNGMQDEIQKPDGLKIPSFLLFDIQPEQLQPLQKFVKDKGHELSNVSSIIRGRITRINDRDFREWTLAHRAPERREESQYRRREFNVSYRSEMSSAETIVEGKDFSKTTYDFNSQEPAEISIAEGFAKWRHVKIGDVLTFDIQGIPIRGRVINLRKVRWNSFQPNFYILFQTGVLEEAPKTFLASISRIEPDERMVLQNAIVASFPNISMINVAQTIKKILGITDRLSFAINFMAYLSILAGLVVLYSIARYEAQRRVWEINLLKILGAGFKDIRTIIQIEFGVLGLTAALLAILLSLAASYAISLIYFDRLWAFQWETSLFNLVAITLLSIVTALAAARKTIRQKPLSILQSV